jgi:type I restriction enzyme M protein
VAVLHALNAPEPGVIPSSAGGNMAVKKSEIYSSLWKGCDELRGGMDASQYKDYVLVLLFMKYVSDRYAGQPDALIEVPEGGSFADMVALKGDAEIGDKINKIIALLAEKNELKGIIDVADFNDPDKLGNGKEMVDRLSKLVSIFSRSELDFRKNRADGDDILGDAYEYLMRHFATESGKSKGQFYTPAEVSRVMAKVIGIGSAKVAEQSIYDPTCGSGSLLLKAHDEAPVDLTIYGQEMDNATRALAKMNMILHGCPTADIWRGNTLAEPYFLNKDGSLMAHDFVVANPPFSNKAWTTGLDPANDRFKRFVYGIPPAKNGDFAFLLHVLASMKSTGKGAIILPHGVLFRGGSEAEIRQAVIRKGYIKGIIGLPPNLFFGTSIPACIVVVDKEHANARTGIFMIDASKGFVKDGNKNRLRDQDVHKIVDVFTRLDETDPKYARMVPFAEIEGHDYNLNIPRYIDSSEPEDLQDIEAHLKGGIPNRDIDALAPYWKVMPGLRGELFGPADRDGYSSAKLSAPQIKVAIHDHPEFQSFAAQVAEAFAGWRKAQIDVLKGIEVGCKPKTLIHALAEDLLARFADVPLLDKYDVYQHLMTYWAEVMQDDVYVISEDGWDAARQVRELVKNSEGKLTETPDITLGKRKLKADLIPPPMIVARFFAAEQTEVDRLELAAEEATQAKEEFEEEHGGEDGLLADARSDTDKLTAASVKARVKVIKKDLDYADEHEALKQWLDLNDRESEAKAAAKDAKAALDTKTIAKYAKLTDAEIKILVVEDKWLAVLDADVQTELDRVSRSLTNRIQQLEERYSVPLPGLVGRVADLTVKVEAHLTRMGFAWN